MRPACCASGAGGAVCAAAGGGAGAGAPGGTAGSDGGFPGVAGGLSLLLAFFALQMLPVNYAGLLLILFGLILFALEIGGECPFL